VGVAAGGALWLLLPPAARLPAECGLAAAWAASTAGTAILLAARGAPMGVFLRGYGMGAAVRGTVLAALAAWSWGRPWESQAALLGTYALGALGFMLVEFRHLRVNAK
ncbi:MAG: hypothetical protein KGL53_05715, partial [Elusimicrobia bacterium]|nr:hypothetical protein [Elusimicrobiota bacterium]